MFKSIAKVSEFKAKLDEAMRTAATGRKYTILSDDEAEVLYYLITLVNSFGYDDTVIEVNGEHVHLDDIMVPTFLKPFLYPRRLTVDTDERAKDLIVRPLVDQLNACGFKYYNRVADIRKAAETVMGALRCVPAYESAASARPVGEVLTGNYAWCSQGFTSYSEGKKLLVPVVDCVYDVFGSGVLRYLAEDEETYFWRKSEHYSLTAYKGSGSGDTRSES